MFRKKQKKTVLSSAPSGVSELVLCVLDSRGRERYRFVGGGMDQGAEDRIRMLDASALFDIPFLTGALESRSSLALSLSSGGAFSKCLHVLPYEIKHNKWRFACLQIAAARPDPDTAADSAACLFAQDRVCLVLVDSNREIRAVSSKIPEEFGYAAENLAGMHVKNLFRATDFARIQESEADAGRPIMGCALFCLDGSRRDVDVEKFSLPDQYELYCICDVSPEQRVEDLAEVTARERQRIGQDLHDSIGQTLTGISLLSRFLANALSRDGHAGSDDASQISELADEASDQVRQISRGLMPADVVQKGLCSSLKELARKTSASCSIQCEAQVDESINIGDVAVEAHLYRIAQEAVNNAVRHAAASRIDLAVSESRGVLQMDIIDNGRWVEPEADVIGIGMKTMEYRTAAIGARLQIGTDSGGGTRVSCRLELDNPIPAKV